MEISKTISLEKENYPMQKIAKVIGESGCYFLCLCYIVRCITGIRVDPIYYYSVFTKERKGNTCWMDEDCYMNYPELVLAGMLRTEIAKHGINFKFESIKITKEYDTFYYPKANQLLIGYFENEMTMKTYGHFVNVDNDKKVVNDPLGESNTVKNGKLKGLRVIEII